MSWYNDDYPFTPEELFAITRSRIAAIEYKAIRKLMALRQKKNTLDNSIYYAGLNGAYKSVQTAESFEEKINRLCVIIISKNRFAVGLEYRYEETAAPVLILKTSDVKWITTVGKKNGIAVIYNKKVAEHVFHNTREYSMVHSDIWKDIAKILKKLIHKDKAFAEKINYTE